MLKLLICLAGSVATAVLLLELRQQRLNLAFQTNELHNRIEATQSQLWNQQLEIAVCTAPNAIAATLRGQKVNMSTPRPSVAPATQPIASEASE